MALQAPFTCCFEMVHFALVTVRVCNPQLKRAVQLQIYSEQLQHEILQTSHLLRTAKTSHWIELLMKYPVAQPGIKI